METFGVLENWSLRRGGRNRRLDCYHKAEIAFPLIPVHCNIHFMQACANSNTRRRAPSGVGHVPQRTRNRHAASADPYRLRAYIYENDSETKERGLLFSLFFQSISLGSMVPNPSETLVCVARCML